MELSSRFSTSGIGGFEVLSEDGGLILGRAWRERAGDARKDVLIVLPGSEQPALTTLDRLTHEYSFKDELDSTWAARPLELVRDRGQTILVLEDPGGELLSAQSGTRWRWRVSCASLSGVAAALGKVHQQGLIHKDIKPANTLVNAARWQVWLTGFGIASRLPRERQAPEPPEFIAGTLPYMAPEQTGRMNRSIDSRSDLYSLGVTLYEMSTGSAPFHGFRSDGMGALPHRKAASAAQRTGARHSRASLGDHHEAARQNRRRAIPDGVGRGA